MTEFTQSSVKVPQAILDFVNQVFEIEKKARAIKEQTTIQRNINKLNSILAEGLFLQSNLGLSYHNPIGEPYKETRTDCEATLSGVSSENLVIIEVIKPIIYVTITSNQTSAKVIVQPAIVIAQSSDPIPTITPEDPANPEVLS
jgi:hypothetical protein